MLKNSLQLFFTINTQKSNSPSFHKARYQEVRQFLEIFFPSGILPDRGIYQSGWKTSLLCQVTREYLYALDPSCTPVKVFKEENAQDNLNFPSGHRY